MRWWPFSKREKINLVAIPRPEDAPPELFDRVTERDPEKAAQMMRQKARAQSVFSAKQAAMAGATHYRWRTAGDGDVCAACATRNGRRFAWAAPPPGGHPGACETCTGGWCRCYAETIV